jgi:hypothetical protein
VDTSRSLRNDDLTIADFIDANHRANEASHGADVDPEAAARAVEIGTIFLAELTENGRDG